ncbi:hypothetical protein PCANB_001074 [Pneumocystis canis]|nr:hypothetical protein PCANB_001074 [Pneumocystis canis]
MVSDEKTSFSVTFLAGAIAGVSEILVMYPLDVVKTRFQLAVGKSEYSGMMDCLVSIVKKEGASRLYRGIVPPVLMEAPKRATKFSANDQWGKFYRNIFKREKMDQTLSLITGATAGATESLVVVPFELIKIRLQDKTSASKYKSTFDCVRKIINTEGPFAFYNGLEATMLRHVMWNSGYFGVIFMVQEKIRSFSWKTDERFNNFIAGTLGGISGTLLNTPFDVAKSRIQNTPKIPGQIPKYNWTIPSLCVIYKEEGFRALYKGFIPKVIRLGPGGGILLVVFDQTSTLQYNTEQACLRYLENNKIERKLHRELHLKYLLNLLANPLPKSYLTLDASRPWIIYWTLCAYALLGQSIDEYKERTIRSIKNLQLDSGGFGGGHGQIAHLASTYASVMSLCLVANDDAYNCINRQQPDGGFLMHEGGEKDARAVYCVLSVASLLNIMTPELIEGTAVWLSRCQTYEGGLSGYPGAEAHGGYAFCVLASLCLIGSPRVMIQRYLNVQKLVRWLALRQSRVEGGFSGRTNKLVDGCYTWWIGGCWAILSAIVEGIDAPLIGKDELRTFILTCCQYRTGGLRDKPEKYPDQYHTCYCIAGLSVVENVFIYSKIEKDDIPLGESVFYWCNDKAVEEEVFSVDYIKAAHPILGIPMDKLDTIRLWHKAFLEGLLGASLTEDFIYRIQQTIKRPKTSIFERLASEDITYYQDIFKRLSEFSWGEKRGSFETQIDSSCLNKKKQRVVNNTCEDENLRVEFILVEWMDMKEMTEQSMEGVQQELEDERKQLLKDNEISSSKSRSIHKISRAQYIPLREGIVDTNRHGIANFGFGVVQIYRYDEEKIFTADERWKNERLTSKDRVVAVLAVPSYITTYDFLGFVGDNVKNQVSHFRFIRTSAPNRYMVLLKFRRFKDAKTFYNTFNGKSFNETEPEKCHIMFIKHISFESKQISQPKSLSDVDDPFLPVSDISKTSQTMSMSTKLVSSPTLGLRELPTCVVCLERMDASVTGLLTILCQHTFHCRCLSKWGENNCPVCRHSQQKDVLDASRVDNQCFICKIQKNLWICLICGHIGCGRYDLAHAYDHYTSTGHCYSMDTETERVWDYAGDGYVHQLIQNKINGNFVGFPFTSYCSNTNTDSATSEQNDLDLKNKLESMSLEYTYLLTSQLELQRIYYEDKVMAAVDKAKKALEEEKQAKKELSSIMEKLSELQVNYNQSQKKLEDVKKMNSQNEKKVVKFSELVQRMEKEWKEERLINSKLMQRIEHLNSENTKMQINVDESKKEIQDLSEQLRDAMFYISSEKHVDTMDDHLKQELQNGIICVPQKLKKKNKK